MTYPQRQMARETAQGRCTRRRRAASSPRLSHAASRHLSPPRRTSVGSSMSSCACVRMWLLPWLRPMAGQLAWWCIGGCGRAGSGEAGRPRVGCMHVAGARLGTLRRRRRRRCRRRRRRGAFGARHMPTHHDGHLPAQGVAHVLVHGKGRVPLRPCAAAAGPWTRGPPRLRGGGLTHVVVPADNPGRAEAARLVALAAVGGFIRGAG